MPGDIFFNGHIEQGGGRIVVRWYEEASGGTNHHIVHVGPVLISKNFWLK